MSVLLSLVVDRFRAVTESVNEVEILETLKEKAGSTFACLLGCFFL